jgi:hypothetical protein
MPVKVPVSIKAKAGSLGANGETRDLSMSGIFLYTASEISAGSELEMLLILPPELTQGEKRWVNCQASVLRVEKQSESSDFGVAARINSMQVVPEILG